MPSRNYDWEAVNANGDFLIQMPGLEYCRRVLNNVYPAAPIFKTMGLSAQSIDPGAAVFTMQPHDYLMHGRGIVHGGAISTLLDTAMAWSAISTLPRGNACTTIQLAVNFIRPAVAETRLIRAEAKVLNAGRRLILVEAKATTPDGKLMATATSTCLVSVIEPSKTPG